MGISEFEPEHSTENHVYRALLHNGIEVEQFQENLLDSWDRLPKVITEFDFVLWTRTGWQPPIPAHKQLAVIEAGRVAGVPVVGYHLDKWWDLARESQIYSEPFFRSDLVITADGGHEEQFKEVGVNHYWMPPGVSLQECERTPRVRPELAHEVVFCGSWNGYHPEWGYRLDLCNWLQNTYGNRVVMYPRPGQHALRGQDLVDLYYNSKVMVGDSCLVNSAQNYFSDRVPETLGRCGFLIHPGVEGMQHHFTTGEHLITYTMGDWTQLKGLIDYYVENDGERQKIAEAGRKHVLAKHTYEVRMNQLIKLLEQKELL